VQVLALWVRVLQAVPTSRILIKGKPFACPHMQEHFKRHFAAAGVDAARVMLLPLEVTTTRRRIHCEAMERSVLKAPGWLGRCVATYPSFRSRPSASSPSTKLTLHCGPLRLMPAPVPASTSLRLLLTGLVSKLIPHPGDDTASSEQVQRHGHFIGSIPLRWYHHHV
jgi:hypothetical protein